MKSIIAKFTEKNLKIKIGAELEFYSSNNDFTGLEIKKEEGDGQYELITPVFDDIEEFIAYFLEAKQKLKGANFAAKPYSLQPGSALHINISLWDEEGNNLYAKAEEEESKLMLYSIAGLLHFLKEDLKIFVPDKEDYQRFIDEPHTPTTISWGANNRTVAVRVPTTDSINRRIEHRVPSPNADITQVVTAILKAILYGIENQILPPEKIYGNASSNIYNLERFI